MDSDAKLLRAAQTAQLEPIETDATGLRQQIEARGFSVSFDGRVSHKCAAWLLGVHPQTLHRLVEAGRVRRERIPHAGSQFSYRLERLMR